MAKRGNRPGKLLRRPQDIQQALKLAARHHRTGRLAEAEALYQRILQAAPENVIALHLLGVVAHQRGDNLAALDLISKALAIDPGYADAHGNLGHVQKALGRPAEALTSFNTAVYLAPDLAEAHNNLGTALMELGRLDDAVESYHMAVTLQPGFAEAHCNNGNALQELGDLEDALACYDQALALRPDYADAHGNRGGLLREMGRIDEAEESFREAVRLNPDDASAVANLSGIEISRLGDPEPAIGGSYASLSLLRRSEYDGAEGEATLARFTGSGMPGFRLKHDVQQADYLVSKGYEVDGITAFRDAGREILQRGEPLGGEGSEQRIRVARDEAIAMLPYLRAELILGTPDLPDGVLNPANDWEALEQEYLQSRNEITHIDDFLSPEALLAFQEFCLVSKVWPKEYGNQYLGGFSDQGFISPLHLQLARELKEKMPALFAAHPLGRFWGFKYDSVLGKGINVHADFALINLNFWITPDQYNLNPDTGGLKIYDVPSPSTWRFRAYNEEKEEIYKFIESHGAGSVTVPYRCNRAVLFNSAYFHETDALNFEDGYESRRINITYLFGDR